MYSGQLCLLKCVLCSLIHEGYVRSVKRYCLIRRYAAVPVQLEIVVLHYIITMHYYY